MERRVTSAHYSMTRARIIAIAWFVYAVAAAFSPAEAGQQIAPTMPLWYMTAKSWRVANARLRHDAVADYMRLFCGAPAMSQNALIACIDQKVRSLPALETLFLTATRCLAELGG